MADRKIKRALISVYDKTGIVDFARALCEEFGIEIISTGGTASLLKENGIPVTLVEEVTGFPEMMDGRVKTLHPKIHAGILADRDNPEHMRQLAEQGIEPIDMVVVNLYPFEKTVADPNCTFEQAIEMIDIGGPCLLRAAAKNHKHVLVVDSDMWYSLVLKHLRGVGGMQGVKLREGRLPFDAFWTTTKYDAEVASWMSRNAPDSYIFGGVTVLHCLLEEELRYGENPHQRSVCVDFAGSGKIDRFLSEEHEPDPEPKMSYNNRVDAHAATELCQELNRADMPKVACFIKHANPCGVGIAADPVEAYRTAYLGDPKAAMGGVLAFNFAVTDDVAHAVMDSLQRWGKEAGSGSFFLDVWIAPSFADSAMEIIRTRKKWGKRVQCTNEIDNDPKSQPELLDFKRVFGGMVVQEADNLGLNEDQWMAVTKRKPTDSEMNDLRLAWLVCKHTKSNAISICKDGMLIGNGAGQMSRVMSCRIATWLAKENGHEEKLRGSVAASDAFFPFSDGPGLLIDAGVSAIIQPGGSKRDADTITLCDERDVAMIFTGTRHFKH